MRCYSICSGIGVFDYVLDMYGHVIVGACEIDKHARQIYERHFPGVRVWPDVTKIRPKELPDFDLLVAGFPCQPFSTTGKRLGFQDIRGTIFNDIVRVTREKRPKLVLLENVKGLLYHDKGRTFGTIIETLDGLGYDVEWQVFDSKYFVPQRRERVFILGHLRGTGSRKIFPIEGICSKIVGDEQRTMLMMSNTKANIKQRLQDRTETWTLDCTGSYFAIKDGDRFRRLTPVEYERFQGLPDNWTKGISDGNRYKCVGNAVTVPVVQLIVNSITLERQRK